MRRARPPTVITEEDLAVMPVEDPAEPVDDFTLPHRPWTPVGASVLAIVAVGALVSISWQLREQTSIARHEACITDAQTAGSMNESQGAMAKALAGCFRHPQAILAGTQVVVPGVVSVRLGQAMGDLALVGLRGRLIGGPAGANAYIIEQAPRVGVSVPAGTVVEIKTRSP